MKTKLLKGAAIAILSFSFAFGTPAAQASPYAEGVTYTPLTQAERDELRQYADASRVKLKEALEQAQGKTFDEANGIYRVALAQVVTTSYNDNRRSELLMRMALNQALELTTGLPGTPAGSPEATGILATIANSNLLTVILEDSIKLALKYIPEDQKALDSGSFAGLPYLQFSLERLIAARLWGAAITENAWQYRYYKAVLRQWFAVATHEAQPRRDAIAKELLTVDDLMKAPTPRSEEGLKAKVRVLRGDMRRLIASLAEVLKLNASKVENMGFEDLKVDASAPPAETPTPDVDEVMPGTSSVELDARVGAFGTPQGGGKFGGVLQGRLEKFVHERRPQDSMFNPSFEVEGRWLTDEEQSIHKTAHVALNLGQLAGGDRSNGPYVQGGIGSPLYEIEKNAAWGSFKGGGVTLVHAKANSSNSGPPGTNYGADFRGGTLLWGSGSFTDINGQTFALKSRIGLLDGHAWVENCADTGRCLKNTLGLSYAETNAESDVSVEKGQLAFSTVLFSNDLSFDLTRPATSARNLRLKAHYTFEYEQNTEANGSRGFQRHLLTIGGSL